jgi:gamma-glutamyl-gamma-aminobutyrate hydrolase PuuD
MPTRTLPLIGIPSCVRSIHERAFHTVNERYTSAVIDAVGGLPVLIPAIGPMADCGAILDRLDGILLTGSPSNVEPHHYGGPPSREGTLHDPDRDATTLPLIREAVRRDMPVLAICRGSQVLNVVLGGDLVQHLPEVVGDEKHMHTPGMFAEHDIEVDPDTRIGELLGDRVPVKSHHHQGFGRLGTGLITAAHSEDGTIEAVEDPSRRFALGVLWHPEAGDDLKLFEELVREALEYRATRLPRGSAAVRQV